MCAQTESYQPGLPYTASTLVDEPLGIPPSEAQIALQQDAVKELMNKVAWVLGSTYRRNYSNIRTSARAYAWRITKKIIEDHGYPDKIQIK